MFNEYFNLDLLFRAKVALTRHRALRAEHLYLLISLGISGIYFYYHSLMGAGLSVILIAGVYSIAFAKSRLKLGFTFLHIALIVYILSIGFANAYNYLFYIEEGQSNLINTLTLTDFQGKYLLVTLLSLFFSSTYILASYSWGNIFLSKALHKDSIGNFLLKTIVGILALGTLMFILMAFIKVDSLSFFTLLFFFPIFLQRNHAKTLIKQAYSTLSKTRQVNLNIVESFTYSSTTLLIASLFASIHRPFSYGSDATRAYLVMVKYLAEQHQLPSTQYYQNFPFMMELLFHPLYAIGGISVVMGVTYLISSLLVAAIILSFRGLHQSQLSRNDLLLVILVPLTYPPLLEIFSGEYKVDIFYSLIFLTSFYSLIRFIKTNQKEYGHLAMFIAMGSVLVKANALPYALLVTAYFLFKFAKRNYVEVLKIIFSSIALLLPWILLYRIKLPAIAKSFGLGLSPRGWIDPISRPFNYCANEVAAADRSFIFKTFDGSIKGYLLLPLEYIRGFIDSNAAFQLVDIGIVCILLIYIGVIILTVNIIKRGPKTMLKGQFLAPLIVSVLSGFITLGVEPTFAWYVAPQIIIVSIWALSVLIKLKYKLILGLLGASMVIHSWTFMLAHAGFVYQPLNISVQRVYEIQDKGTSIYSQAKEIGDSLKKGNILVSTNAYFTNINFFLPEFYDRTIYFNEIADLEKSINIEQLTQAIEKYDLKYLILNKGDNGVECLIDSEKKIKEIYMQKGALINSNDSFELYLVK